jgi:hypothetical protein
VKVRRAPHKLIPGNFQGLSNGRRCVVAGQSIYVEMAHHPQVILDTMVEIEREVARAKVQQKLLQYLPYAVMAIGVVGFVAGGLLASITQNPSLAILSFVVAGVGILLAIYASKWRIPLLQEHFGATRLLLHTLRDDTGRRGRVVGRLDLSGPQQDRKTIRTARSGGGKKKVYYRDPWFRAKFKLVDGNVLRLTLEDKVKTKANSIVRHQTQFTAKLVVNPDLYFLGEVPQGAIPVKSATLTHEDGVLVLKGAGTAKSFSARRVLELLKFMYKQILDVEHPQPPFARLRAMAEEEEQARRAGQPVTRLRQGLEERGFQVSPRSERLYYHPQIPDTRFAIATRVVRIERRNAHQQRWDLVRSYSMAREIDLALEAADAMLAELKSSG